MSRCIRKTSPETADEIHAQHRHKNTDENSHDNENRLLHVFFGGLIGSESLYVTDTRFSPKGVSTTPACSRSACSMIFTASLLLVGFASSERPCGTFLTRESVTSSAPVRS